MSTPAPSELACFLIDAQRRDEGFGFDSGTTSTPGDASHAALKAGPCLTNEVRHSGDANDAVTRVRWRMYPAKLDRRRGAYAGIRMRRATCFSLTPLHILSEYQADRLLGLPSHRRSRAE